MGYLLFFCGDELGDIVSAEGTESYAEVALEYLIAIDDLSMIET